ncbi:MAG: protein yhaM [Firmicutes bacterium]|nr:protein yhaM [Bacillota bacterium]
MLKYDPVFLLRGFARSPSAMSGYKAVLLALEGIRVTGNDGIVAEDVDRSIANLGVLACQGMTQMDEQILQIMLNKK